METTTRKPPDTSSRKKSLSKTPITTGLSQPANGNGGSPSNGEVLRQLYFGLLKCRVVEQFAQQRLSTTEYDFVTGQEAVVVATTFGLRAEDTVTASRANVAALVAGGTSLRHLLMKGGGNPSASYGSGAVVTLASLPTDPFNIGTGVALAHKIEKKGNVVIALCTETSPPLDRWHEALKFAGAHKLPILYVVKGAAANSPAAGSQNAHLDDFSFMARDYGFPGIIVDGGDVVAVWRVAQESLHRARNGAGPTLIDCTMEAAKDPLTHMEHYMRKRSVWDEEWKKQISRQARAEMEAAVEEGVDQA